MESTDLRLFFKELWMDRSGSVRKDRHILPDI